MLQKVQIVVSSRDVASSSLFGSIFIEALIAIENHEDKFWDDSPRFGPWHVDEQNETGHPHGYVVHTLEGTVVSLSHHIF